VSSLQGEKTGLFWLHNYPADCPRGWIVAAAQVDSALQGFRLDSALRYAILGNEGGPHFGTGYQVDLVA
jgi:hypothetical protein